MAASQSLLSWTCALAALAAHFLLLTDTASAASLPGPVGPHGSPREASADQAWEQELTGLKEQILKHVAGDLEDAWRARELAVKSQEHMGGPYPLQKRMFVPVSGLPGEAPTIKRQIRYHQCYFNPISCFKKK